ncbi:hypothetical protein PG985_000092 [Apiospora marii]|uniref:uncharacterized protein n=1 Tax=Apiospora marii TaxID=335849 RepID=UPI00312DB67A
MTDNPETTPKMGVYRAPPPAPSSTTGFASGSSTPWTFVAGFFKTPEREWLDGIPREPEGFDDLVWSDDGDNSEVTNPADDDLVEVLVDDYWVYLGTRADLREKKRRRDVLLGKCD